MKTSTYYHEDDHAMVQLIAEENLPLIWYEFVELIGYDDIERKIDTNAREIFGSNKLKFSLIERAIPVRDLENLCLSHGLMPIEEVYTGYGNHSEIEKKLKHSAFLIKTSLPMNLPFFTIKKMEL